jgi:pimeloyl-ACP methyl ester carboxylesterase
VILKHKGGGETFYKEYGDPSLPAVVLLHGLGADHSLWAPQVEPFADAGLYVLTPDLLAHGRSSRVKTLSLADWERQILDLLAEKGIERCIPIGVSMGGVIALSFAANHPERIEKLVVSDTFAELKTVQERVLGFSQVIGFRLFRLLGHKTFARGMASAYKATYAGRAREYMEKTSLDADFDQLILARKAINKIDVLDKLKVFEQPALVLVGEEFGDSFVEINKKIANALQDARFVQLKKSMDPSNLVNSEDFNREVLNFLI